jgi:hypothetical protein
MNKILLGAFALAAVVASPAANAAVFTPADTANFSVNYESDDGSISATIGNKGLSGIFEDTFNFNLLTNGTGSGGVIASFTSALNSIKLTSVTINGAPITIKTDLDTGFTSASARGIILSAGPNSIVIRGQANKNASYGGNITFVPNAVPEPATWAMMLVGFGMVAGTMRYRRRATKVVYA